MALDFNNNRGIKDLFKGQIFDDIKMDQKYRPLSLVAAIFFILAAIFALRLVYLQVVMSDQYTAMAQETRTINFDTTPRRGTIYDRNGMVLAVSVDATTIYCNPTEVTDPAYEAYMLAQVMGGNTTDYLPKLENDSRTFVYIQRQADVELAKRVKELKLDGIYFIADTRREYPNGAIGGQVIGVCDADGNGITGLELQYDDILRGTPGTYSAERGEKGTPIPGGVHEDIPAIDGEDIMISLDIKLQDVMEQALAKGIEVYEAKKAPAIAMDAENGEILAICSYPFLDPTNLAESTVGSDNLTAITQFYEPGSIFKGITALAVLESGAVGPSDYIYCPKELQADEYVITDAHEREDVTLTFTQILSQSSNVGTSLAAERAGFDKLNNVIKKLKITEPTGVDYPGEACGSVQDFNEWARVTGYNVSFGQGITATPLQMVRAYGAIVNDGVITSPHFLISKPQTGTYEEYETEKVWDDQDSIDQLKTMLQGVVRTGTGKNAAVAGYDIAGKTSTAQIAENGSYAQSRYNLGFMGFVNNSNSKIVCFVGANDVIYEGNVSNIFGDIMKEVVDQYNVVPEGDL